MSQSKLNNALINFNTELRRCRMKAIFVLSIGQLVHGTKT